MNRLLHWSVAAACEYEAIALASGGRLPTITGLQARHRPLAWAVLALLGWHFWQRKGEHDAKESY